MPPQTEAENIFTIGCPQVVWDIMNRVSSVKVEIDGRNVTWKDECRMVAIGVTYEDISVIAWAWNWVNPSRCPNFIEICVEMSILHVLSPNATVTEEFIHNLNQSEILRLINAGEKENVLQYLGGVDYDTEGNIVSARATKLDLVSETNITEALMHPDLRARTPVTNTSMTFEEHLKEAMLNTSSVPEGFSVSVIVSRSFDDVINENILH